jgi:hypothetical protein
LTSFEQLPHRHLGIRERAFLAEFHRARSTVSALIWGTWINVTAAVDDFQVLFQQRQHHQRRDQDLRDPVIARTISKNRPTPFSG